MLPVSDKLTVAFGGVSLPPEPPLLDPVEPGLEVEVLAGVFDPLPEPLLAEFPVLAVLEQALRARPPAPMRAAKARQLASCIREFSSS
ncbi:MAG: hypothetical protein M0Z87_08895 [Actinomycetota bacterium]|nr:hypothetical protein [Actinomycetota bacterium]